MNICGPQKRFVNAISLALYLRWQPFLQLSPITHNREARQQLTHFISTFVSLMSR